MAINSLLPQIVGVALVSGGLLWTGYVRRRDTWTRQSWRRFGFLLALSVVALAAAFRMAHGVDQGVYEGMDLRWRRAYFYAMTALLLGGVASGIWLVLWFARGDPNRQLSRRPTPSGERR